MSEKSKTVTLWSALGAAIAGLIASNPGKALEVLQWAVDLAVPLMPYAAVLFTGWVISGALTQIEKTGWRLLRDRYIGKLDDNAQEIERFLLQILAAVNAAVPVYILWEWSNPGIAALAAGPVSPFLYQITVGLAIRKWPALEAICSANPVRIDRDEDGNIIGVKDGENPTVTIPRNKP